MLFQQRLLVGDDFNFAAVVESHGWVELAPFKYVAGDAPGSSGTLYRVHQMGNGRVVSIRVMPDGNTSRKAFLNIQTEGQVYPTDAHEIDAVVRAMLAVDRDMTVFYAALPPGYDWVKAARVGRMLRAPSVWEDMVKTLLTTNTTWKQTTDMVKRLMDFGDDSEFGRAFPTPAQIAAVDEAALTAHLKCGYRGAYLHELAAKIALGEMDVESWVLLDSAALYKALHSLKGFGEYATGSIMRLLGHHDRLSIDSVARDAFERVHKYRATDAQIAAHYAPFGTWRGLMMWMDVLHDAYV